VDENDWLPRLWATRRVGWLMEQIRSNGEQRELVDEVTQLGTRYGIVTPYTSFLALEPGAVVDDRDRERPRADGSRGVARQRPSNGAPPPPAPPPPPPMVYTQDVTGQGAVAQSRASREMQEATITDYYKSVAGEPSVQRVGDKTFYLREGVWTDAELRADARLPETTVTFGSNEYYALLGRIPALGRYFALGEQVAVVVDGHLYRVRAPTH
jgi:Ca-activated chloride channel family protein